MKEIVPKYAEEINEIEVIFNQITLLCNDSNTGIFAALDNAWTISEEIHDEWSGIKNQIEDVMNYDSNQYNINDASRSLFWLDYQTHMMHHYLEGTTTGTRTKFIDAGAELEFYLAALITQTNNLTTQSNMLYVENWHENNFEGKILANGTGLFDSLDHVDSQYAIIHAIFKDLRDNMDTLDNMIIMDLDRAKSDSANLSNLSLILTIVVISISSISGVIIAIPTIRGIVRITKILLKAGTEASVNVSNMATELAASASEVNAASEEIASTTQEVSMNTQGQVDSLIEISKMSNDINDLSHEMMKSASDINRIMDLITNVSDQTNLLALNASIEAGRAGEHGRGFAVVADEVRKLAEESKNATDETGKQVKDITTRIQSTVELIGAITQDIESTTAAGKENSRALEGISASSEQQVASMEEITATANKLGGLAEDLKNSLAISDGTNGKAQKGQTKEKQKPGLKKKLSVLKTIRQSESSEEI
ncbi:MAG: methyl-accepting chemotaxis protein [Candidatus Lokiarchaeia archaeon]